MGIEWRAERFGNRARFRGFSKSDALISEFQLDNDTRLVESRFPDVGLRNLGDPSLGTLSAAAAAFVDALASDLRGNAGRRSYVVSAMSARKRGTVVLTGAAGQVGWGLAQRLRGVGPLALIGPGSAPPGADAQAPVRAFGRVDLRDEVASERVVGEVRTALGPIRALVHAVGAYADGRSVAQQPLEQAQRMLEANFLSALAITRAVLPDLLDNAGARIVLFASADALRARAGASAYGASKAALLRFAEALAGEVTGRCVGVCVLLPTTIDTPAARAAAPGADTSGWVTLDQIASLVTFLLDPASDGIRFAAIPLGR